MNECRMTVSQGIGWIERCLFVNSGEPQYRDLNEIKLR